MGIMMIAGTERRRQGCSLQDGKQWGYYVESQNPTDYRYWSIPFTSHYITMATKTYYEPKEEAVPWLVGIDMQKFICGYGANFIGSSYVSCVGIGCQPQWGMNIHGWVTFPITFVKFRRLVTNHQGNVFMDSKARESNTLSGFTLDVADNSDQNKDAQWIAIGA